MNNTVITENSEIERRLLYSNYDFKKSNMHKTQQLCSVNRPISLIMIDLITNY